MLSSTSEARRLFEKYEFQPKDSHHTMYQLFYKGKFILGSRVSHGHKQIPPPIVQEIRRQMRLSSTQFDRACSCTLTLEEYIEILRERGYISDH